MTAASAAGAPDIDYDAWRAAIRRDALSNHYYCMARAIAREGNRAAAIDRLRHAIAADGAMVAAHAELAELLRAEGRTAEAEAAERTAAGLSADWRAEARLRQGEELAAVERPDEALEALAAAWNEAARSPALRERARALMADIHLARGLVLGSAGDSAGAVAAFRQALAHAGEDSGLLHRLSLQILIHGTGEEAAALAVRSARLAPAGRRVGQAVDAARILRKCLHLEEAAAVLGEALAAEAGDGDPELATACFLLAQALAVLGRPAPARRAARAAVALRPEWPPGWIMFAHALCAAGHTAEAAGLFRRALACNPRQATAMAGLALILTDEGRHEEAVAQARAALARAEGSEEYPSVAWSLAAALLAAGRPEEARVALRRGWDATRPEDRGQFWIRSRYHPRHAAALAPLCRDLGLVPPPGFAGPAS